MFSVFPTPRTSFAPIPPTPMLAMLSLSLGARRSRPRLPRTCGGTMVNDRPAAATSPTNFRRVEIVGGAGGCEPRQAVRMMCVIQHLHFGSVPVDGVTVFARAVEDAAVAGLCDFPVERQLEIAEFLVGDDVTTGAHARQRADLHLPSIGNRRLAVVPPAGGGFAVEQQAPARRALGIRQSVWGGVGRGWWRL